MPDISRRRLLQALACAPLLTHLPLYASGQPAARVIALEWLSLELLLALGVMPLGAAELHNYHLWVGDPALPPAVIDVGLRSEPNLELITQLTPSLILHSSDFGSDVQRLGRIAPVMGFTFNDQQGKPLTLARHSLLQLAERLDRIPQAQAHLAQLDNFMQQMRLKLAGRARRPLLLMSILDARHAIVFGRNSLFLEVMANLGIENAWQGESTFWGSAVIGIERLAALENVDAVCFEHGDNAVMEQVTSTALWQALPFVREKRFKQAPRVWFYGATLSAMRFCQILDQTLEAR